jgi:hypothetical protein
LSLIRRLRWIPPFVVGLSAAVAAEVAVGLLLYVTPGFLRALTLILAVLLSSLALGLWTAPHNDEGLTERLRRRWLLVLFAYAAGSVVAGAWTVRGGLAESPVTQGFGLALLAALPLYSCGALLGGMSAPRLLHVRGPVGSSAAAGAAVGTVLAGYVLAALLHPVSIYAFCLVLLSGAAIVHGWLIAAEGERRKLSAAPSPYGPVIVEEWSWGKSRRERVVRENGRVRGVEDAHGHPVRKWEVAAVEVIAGALEARRARAGGVEPEAPMAGASAADATAGALSGVAPGSAPTDGAAQERGAVESEAAGTPAAAAAALAERELLEAPLAEPGLPRTEPAAAPCVGSIQMLGAGALTLAKLIVERNPDVDVHAVERNPVIVDAVRTHFAPPADASRLTTRAEDPRDVMEGGTGPHLAIALDSSALAPHDPLALSEARQLRSLRGSLAEGGVLLLGGIEVRAAEGAPLDHLLSEGLRFFPSAAVFLVERTKGAPPVSNAPGSDLMVVFSTDPEAVFPASAGELKLDATRRRQPVSTTADTTGELP